ncbi:ATP-binding protein [Nocardiopsis metallicus]|uniref:Serine/threonine-protein kinase RsbW n=1 Tax=Nocardiopsis metallicus TaxID=179819 RepID=A0A840WQN6_9ACTN|nr:ATP-binding protein [Nocardiopsis metallicus]MBB5494165.1 serine/threonine-protein kinase RsbW [Nocardiopsis metallicus]
MDTVFSISLPRQAYTVAVVRDILGALLSRSGLCRECVDDILLAASEACANAVEHGAPSPDYEVEVELAPGWCELQISHTGRAPDTAALVQRFTSEHTPLPGLEAESGRGILLMRYLMDEVDFSGEPRTTVILRKRLTACDPASGDTLPRSDPAARFALL